MSSVENQDGDVAGWPISSKDLVQEAQGVAESQKVSAPSGAQVGDAAAFAGVINLDGDLDDNSIQIGQNITVSGTVRGSGNVIRIAPTRNPQKIHIAIYGNNNKVTIGPRSLLQSMKVEIGSPRWRCSRARLKIGRGFSIGSRGRLILANSGNVMEIGDNCMFSSGITLRGGEYPHLLFDKNTGEYLDVSDGIFIGNHVWIGEGVFVSKAVTIPHECIVGAKSVVTKRFEEENCVIAGNPARIVKRGIQWVANEYSLASDFDAGQDSFEESNLRRINRAEAAHD
ncbi:hypothetical protein NSDW_29570 [Novosphingobium olei]|nr:hypothetical protein NSDW_29570 [Novosphingobium olei]